MIVPIDLLPPILDDLLTYGRVNKPAAALARHLFAPRAAAKLSSRRR